MCNICLWTNSCLKYVASKTIRKILTKECRTPFMIRIKHQFLIESRASKFFAHINNSVSELLR